MGSAQGRLGWGMGPQAGSWEGKTLGGGWGGSGQSGGVSRSSLSLFVFLELSHGAWYSLKQAAQGEGDIYLLMESGALGGESGG